MLNQQFFQQNAIDLAKALLGKYLIRNSNNEIIVTQIVETEAYMGISDKGAHVYGNKKTDRTKPLYLDGGHVYVYLIYGMYYCLNISANLPDIPECVLIRALSPVSGIDEIAHNRYNLPFENLSRYQKNNLLNGPGKLCKGLQIEKDLNSKSILSGELTICDSIPDLGTAAPILSASDIIADKRVNIDYAEEAKDYLWRFYIKDNPFVSKPIRSK